MDPRQTRRLGRTDVALTQLGFGGAPLGDLKVAIDERQAEATLSAAWDAGIRYFDTSPWYGRGQSEHRFGRFLYRRPRRDFVLSTKVGRVFAAPADPARFEKGDWAGGLDFDHAHDYGYDGIRRAYEDSQQRLGMTRIDLLLIHDLDFRHFGTEAGVRAHFERLLGGGWRALAELREAGAIRAIGAGINETGLIPRFLDATDIDFFLVAMPYTLLNQEILEPELAACERRGIGVVIGAVFNSGILATGPVERAQHDYLDADDAVKARVGRMQAVCEAHGVALAAAALQFPLGHPCVASVIPGAFTPEQVRANAAHFGREIPPALWSDLKAEGLVRADAPTPA